MLLLARAPARIAHQPRLETAIEGAPSRRVAAAVRHHATYHHPLHLLLQQHAFQPRVQKCIVRVLPHHRISPFLYCIRDGRLQGPVRAADGDGAVRAPFAHELVLEGRSEFLLAVPVLREDQGAGGTLEVGNEGEDVGEGVGGHGGEDGLHIDYEEGGRHVGR